MVKHYEMNFRSLTLIHHRITEYEKLTERTVQGHSTVCTVRIDSDLFTAFMQYNSDTTDMLCLEKSKNKIHSHTPKVVYGWYYH